MNLIYYIFVLEFNNSAKFKFLKTNSVLKNKEYSGIGSRNNLSYEQQRKGDWRKRKKDRGRDLVDWEWEFSSCVTRDANECGDGQAQCIIFENISFISNWFLIWLPWDWEEGTPREDQGTHRKEKG